MTVSARMEIMGPAMRIEPAGYGALAAVSAALAFAIPAAAQVPPLPGTIVPSLGSNEPDKGAGGYTAPWPSPGPMRLGDMGFPYTAVAVPEDGPTEEGWRITPSLGLEFLATDNLYQSHSDTQSEFITTLTPGIFVTVDTSRIKGILNYQPDLRLYTSDNSLSGIDHQFNGQFLLSVIPNAIFLDVRGNAAVQAASGGYAASGDTVATSRGSEVQSTSFQISPYWVHRFGGLATLQVGYAFQKVTQDIRDDGSSAFTPEGQSYFSDQDFTANEFYAVARTGEDLGRVALEGRAISTDYDGSGVLEGAYRRIAAVEARYAVTRFVSVLGEVGYEQQRYSGIPPFRISEPVWSAGTKLTFSPESSITARYGRHDGFDSARVDAALSLGVRTRMFASYSERLTTAAQRTADLLNTTTLDELGNPVDTETGAPSVLPFSNSLLGIQSSLMRVRSASASVSQDWGRDILTLTLLREERKPVSVEIGTVATRQSGTSAGLSWSHALTPATTAIGYMQYGTFETPSRGSGNVFSVGATLVSQLTPDIVASLQLMTSSRSDDVTDGRAIQNTIIAGVRKTF
jgi:uncharacterized protein (PEP-CTERM system associated)